MDAAGCARWLGTLFGVPGNATFSQQSRRAVQSVTISLAKILLMRRMMALLARLIVTHRLLADGAGSTHAACLADVAH